MSMTDLEESMAVIKTSIGWLSKSVSELTRIQSDQLRRTRRLALVAIAGLAINVILVIGAGFLANKVISESAASTRAQSEASSVHLRFAQEGTCPLYAIIISGYNPDSPDALAAPAPYERQFSLLRQASKDFGCP